MKGDQPPVASVAGPPGESPIVAMRRRFNLGRAPFARAVGVSLPAVWGAEKGTTGNPVALLRALEHLGYDSARLLEGYRQWRREVVAQAGNRLKVQIQAANAADLVAAEKLELRNSA